MTFYIHGNKLLLNKKDKDDKKVELDINPSIVFCKPKQVVALFTTSENAENFCRIKNLKDKEHEYYYENAMFYDDRVITPDAVQFEFLVNSYTNKVYSINKIFLYGNVLPQNYSYIEHNEKVYVEIIKYSDCTKNTEKELRDKYENL